MDRMYSHASMQFYQQAHQVYKSSLPFCRKSCCKLTSVLDISSLENPELQQPHPKRSPSYETVSSDSNFYSNPEDDDVNCTETNHNVGFYLADVSLLSSSSGCSSDCSSMLSWEDCISVPDCETAFCADESYEHLRPRIRYVSGAELRDQYMAHTYTNLTKPIQKANKKQSLKHRGKNFVAKLKSTGIKVFRRK